MKKSKMWIWKSYEYGIIVMGNWCGIFAHVNIIRVVRS
jgi:hypothetical protein